MAKRRGSDNLGDRLLKSAEQAVEIAKGTAKPGSYQVTRFPPRVDVAELLAELGMKQTQFAETYCLSVHTVRGWLKGKQPDQTAAAFLATIKADPKRVAKALRNTKTARTN